MLNPIKVDPGTKMPAFADAEGQERDSGRVRGGRGSSSSRRCGSFLLREKDVKPPQYVETR
jgi:hypothetical protein